ncbi:hypothetical protein J3A64_002035 [Pseudarthrobacter sp. PvP004]|jgi:hypothetical protein|nr:hypothetical protein [Pseudarthrobacter sp. PvP004]
MPGTCIIRLMAPQKMQKSPDAVTAVPNIT